MPIHWTEDIGYHTYEELKDGDRITITTPYGRYYARVGAKPPSLPMKVAMVVLLAVSAFLLGMSVGVLVIKG